MKKENNMRIPKQSRSIDKKNRIIQAGLKVFSEKGYHNTNTAEIAKIAGVSTGIVYSYFEDKKDIFLYSIKLYFDNIFDPLILKMEHLKTLKNIEEIITEMTKTIIKSHENNFTSHEEMIAMSHLDEDVHKLFIESEIKVTDCFTELLTEKLTNVDNVKEKTHIAYNLIETLCHEYIYHKHVGINYDIMIKETIDLIIKLFKA